MVLLASVMVFCKRFPTNGRYLGGRTAWSAVCELDGQSVNARYWYDGQYVNNAKEDAAEVMLIKVGAQAPEKH